jgi:hypothetical protein
MGGYRSYCSICGVRVYDQTFSRSYCSRKCKAIARARDATRAWLKDGERRWTVLHVPSDVDDLERGGILPNELVRICLYNGTFDTGTIIKSGNRTFVIQGDTDSKQYLVKA